MKIICKVENAECPHKLNICCGTCEHLDTCEVVCEEVLNGDCLLCSAREAITGELMQFESAVPETIQKITTLIQMKKQLDEQEKELKQKLVEAMETYNIKIFENDQIKMTYVAPTTRSTIDSTRLKKDHPDLAEQYSKTSNVSASVRVTVK
jgi:predicted phage-related endonuclease